MKVFNFSKDKYHFPLQMDLGIIEETPHFFFYPEVHCTDFFEIMIFRKGNGHILLDTQHIEIADSSFLFISPFQKRSWYVDAQKLKGHYLIFEKQFLNDFFSDHLFVYRLQYFFNRKVIPSFVANKYLFSFENDIFDEIFKEIREYQNDSHHLLRSILYYMLIKLNRSFCEFHHLKNDTQINNHAYQFKEALEKNFIEKQQVNDYTQILGISRISLNAAVKKQFGLTATEMIKDRIIFEIKSELRYTTKTISEIAYSLNFSEPNNMIRLFKSKTSNTPSQFRKLPLK